MDKICLDEFLIRLMFAWIVSSVTIIGILIFHIFECKKIIDKLRMERFNNDRK